MRKYNTLLIVLLIFLMSCGYKPIFSSKDKMFSINNIEFLTANKINSKIENQLKIYQENKNKSKFYDLVIGINTKKTISLRDSSGDPKIFLMSIDVNVNVQENNNSIGNKNFSEDFSYNNMENKFDLSKYEKNIENNIINKITERIVTYLHSI
tara:strand:+ start:691 stop:1149 length:459 start_codon:yes stop_codon:yes gene_type:complete